MFSIGLMKLKREEFDNLSLTGNGTVCRQLRLIQSVDSYSGCDEADMMDEFCWTRMVHFCQRYTCRQGAGLALFRQILN